MVSTDIQVRNVSQIDRQRLANLINFEEYVHRHLDWKPPLDWIGNSPYVVAERGDELVAALACPPELPEVAWLRLFAVKARILPDEAWQLLWAEAQRQLAGMGVRHAFALALQDWFVKLLVRQAFVHVQDVAVLVWESQSFGQKVPNRQVGVRQLYAEDLPKVSEVDNLAFGVEWSNSQDALGMAFRQSSIATVAEIENEVVGYQISTANPMGGHLARLAVCPASQGKGVGSTLVYTLLDAFVERGVNRVTVNTQTDNQASLAIYRKCGFELTGDIYPVFRLCIAKGDDHCRSQVGEPV